MRGAVATQMPLTEDAAATGTSMKETRPSITCNSRAQGFEEQRSSPRVLYGYRQSIAPITDADMPAFDELTEVTCKDLSGGGMSFYADDPPRYKRLLVALGPPGKPDYFLAQVVRISRELNDGRERCLVGCRFVQRIGRQDER